MPLCAFLRACMSKKESKNSIPKTLSHPLIFYFWGWSKYQLLRRRFLSARLKISGSEDSALPNSLLGMNAVKGRDVCRQREGSLLLLLLLLLLCLLLCYRHLDWPHWFNDECLLACKMQTHCKTVCTLAKLLQTVYMLECLLCTHWSVFLQSVSSSLSADFLSLFFHLNVAKHVNVA